MLRIICLFILGISLLSSCQKEENPKLATETSLRVSSTQDLSQAICFGESITFEIDLESKHGIGLKSFEVKDNNNHTLVQMLSLDASEKLTWSYSPLEEDVNTNVVLTFRMVDAENLELNEQFGVEVTDAYQYYHPVFYLNQAFDLKSNIASTFNDPNTDISVEIETESCGTSCTRYKHTLRSHNGSKMYSFPNDYLFSVDYQGLKPTDIEQAIKSIEAVEEIIAYNALESELDSNILYISNAPLAIELRESGQFAIIQIVSLEGLWNYKKVESSSGL